MINIDITGLDKLEAQLKQVVVAVSDAKSIARRTAEQYLFREILDFARHIFDVEGIEPWEDLNDLYALRKANEYPGQTILRREDVLYEAYTDEVTEDYGLFPHINYAQYHETGTEDIPARPVFGQIREYFNPNREAVKGIYRDELANQILKIVNT